MQLIRIVQFSLIGFFSTVFIFHILVLSRIIPYEIVWGGRIQNNTQFIILETISILVNSYFLFIMCLHAQLIKGMTAPRFTRIGLWIMLVLFTLNTLGNALSLNRTEMQIMTPITAIISLMSAFLLFSKKK